jgi:competence protein ComEA
MENPPAPEKSVNFFQVLKENLFEWFLASVGVTLILFGFAQHFGWLEEEKGASLTVIKAEKEKKAEELVVDIGGAVAKPGVYYLPASSRVNDLLIAAGGVTNWAQRSFLEKELNRARLLQDGEKIYIPYIGEQLSSGGKTGVGGEETVAGKININTASVGELEALPGIGFTYASAIVEYREEKGNFSSIEEIKNVSGIGEKTFEKIKDLISVN